MPSQRRPGDLHIKSILRAWFHDEAAEEACTANGNGVVMLFASAQIGLSNAPGQLWIYDQSHVMLLRDDCNIPPCPTQMEMREDVETLSSKQRKTENEDNGKSRAEGLEVMPESCSVLELTQRNMSNCFEELAKCLSHFLPRRR